METLEVEIEQKISNTQIYWRERASSAELWCRRSRPDSSPMNHCFLLTSAPLIGCFQLKKNIKWVANAPQSFWPQFSQFWFELRRMNCSSCRWRKMMRQTQYEWKKRREDNEYISTWRRRRLVQVLQKVCTPGWDRGLDCWMRLEVPLQVDEPHPEFCKCHTHDQRRWIHSQHIILKADILTSPLSLTNSRRWGAVDASDPFACNKHKVLNGRLWLKFLVHFSSAFVGVAADLKNRLNEDAAVPYGWCADCMHCFSLWWEAFAENIKIKQGFMSMLSTGTRLFILSWSLAVVAQQIYRNVALSHCNKHSNPVFFGEYCVHLWRPKVGGFGLESQSFLILWAW